MFFLFILWKCYIIAVLKIFFILVKLRHFIGLLMWSVSGILWRLNCRSFIYSVGVQNNCFLSIWIIDYFENLPLLTIRWTSYIMQLGLVLNRIIPTFSKSLILDIINCLIIVCLSYVEIEICRRIFSSRLFKHFIILLFEFLILLLYHLSISLIVFFFSILLA